MGDVGWFLLVFPTKKKGYPENASPPRLDTDGRPPAFKRPNPSSVELVNA